MADKSRHPVLQFTISAGLWLFVLGLTRYLHRPFGLDFDGAEQTYLSQWLELGFGIQPPLPSWIFYLVFDLFGYSVAWVHAVRLLLIFLIYVGFYKLSLRLIKRPVLALLTTLSLVFIFQFSSVMLKQMHTVFVTLAVIFSWLCILDIYEKGRLRSFLWLGFWIGIGFISKYNFFIHVSAMALATIIIPDFRRRVFQPKMLVSVILAFLICCPHYLWLLDNFDGVSQGVNEDMKNNLGSSRLQDFFSGLSALLIKLLSFLGLLLLVFTGFFFSPFKSNLKRKEPLVFKLISRYLIFSIVFLGAVILFTRATIIHEHWLQPFLIIFPVLLFQKLKGSEGRLEKRFRVFRIVCLFIFFLISVDFAFKSYVRLYTGHPASVFNIPYKSMADLIDSYSPDCETIFTQDPVTAGHLKMIMPEKLVLVNSDIDHIAMESLSILRSDKLVFIWGSKKNQNQVPFDIELFKTALDQDISVNIDSPEFDSFNYILTDKKMYRAGVTKITFNP